MNSPRSWKIGLCLALLALASAASGALLGHRLARRQYETRSNPETWNEHVSREFDRRIKPTPDQAARIQKYLDQAVSELQQIRRDTIARSTNVIWRLAAEVERELTPDQRQAFEGMKPRSADVGLDVLHLPPDPARSEAPRK